MISKPSFATFSSSALYIHTYICTQLCIYKIVFNIFSYKSITSHFNVICYRHRSFHCSKLYIKCMHIYRRTTRQTSNPTSVKTSTSQRAFVCACQHLDIQKYKFCCGGSWPAGKHTSTNPHLHMHIHMHTYWYAKLWFSYCLRVSVYVCVLKSNHRDGVYELKINGELKKNQKKKRRCGQNFS